MRPLIARMYGVMHRSTAVLGALLSLLAACSKKDESRQLAPAASALAASTADPAAVVWHYVLDPTSVAHVEMPGLKETIKGSATGAAGTLDVVPRDLTKSRGLVRIDLATFATHTFNNDDDATQTKHARTWLEVQVGDKTNADMRWAELAIRSIDGLSDAADLTAMHAGRDGQEDVRALTMTVHGELLIHGHKVPGDDVVDVTFRYPPGTAADAKPARMTIKSRQPMRVVLKELDIRPRDPAGIALAWTSNLIAKVADVADVTVDLTAAPAP
jgi:hypothetical protein